MTIGQTSDIQIFDLNGKLSIANAGRPFSVINMRVVLESNVAYSLTVPYPSGCPNAQGQSIPSAYTVFFRYGGTPYGIWVLPSDSPTLILPPAGGSDTSLAQLNPEVRRVVPGQTLQFLFRDYSQPGSTGVYVPIGLEFYANSGNTF